MRRLAVAALAVAALAAPADAALITLNVTPASTLKAAVATANADTDLANSWDIRLAPGTYLNDFAPTITRPMTIEGTGGAANTILKASVPLPNQKGILLTVASLTVRGLTLTGAAISNALGGNGAGIRDQIGTGGSDPNGTLNVQASVFKDNQEGILTGGSGGKEHVIVNASTFRDNGNPASTSGQVHGLYVNDAATTVVAGSSFCGEVGAGHNVKVRSARTSIVGVQSWEGTVGGGCTNAGNASRGIDVPNGGVLTMTAVDLFQGPGSPNSGMLDFGLEGVKYITNSLTMRDVDFVSTSGGVGIQWGAGSAPCLYDPASSFSGVAVSSPSGVCRDPPLDPIQISARAAPASIPEPGSLALLGVALAGMLVLRRSTRKT